MYLSGYVDIDPSHATEVRRKPTKGFRRFAEMLTGGALSQQEEHETFTALSILQEINIVLRSLNITDVVRFTKDNIVVYDDQDGQSSDDMGIVIETISRESGLGDRVFESMSLLLEHHLPDITLVIDVRINRTHFVGGYPIRIAVNGLATELQAQSESALNDKLEKAFVNQDSYTALETKLREQFDSFMIGLELVIRQKMMIDDVRYSTQVNIVRPRTDEHGQSGSSSSSDSASNSDPVFQRYHSGSDAFLYCWLWSSMMHSHGTHVQDATIVDEQGQHLMTVGEEGFNAGESTAMDPSVPFDQSDASMFDSSAALGDDSTSRMSGFSGEDNASSGSSWLDSFGFGDSSGSDSGSGFNSCGGGCGGGD